MASSDVSSVVNYFPFPNEGFTTTLGSTIASGASVVPLNATAGLTNGQIFVGIIEPSATNQQVFTGTVDVSGSQITGVKWTRGTNVGHAGGVTIVDYVTGTALKMISTGILKQHTQTGTHTGLTTDTIVTSGNATVGGTLGVTGTATHSGATVLTGAVSGAGYDAKTLANSYKFSVYLSVNQSLSAVTWTKVTLDTKEYDTGTNFDAVTNHRFTAPITGFYQLAATVIAGVAGISGTASATGALYKNGVLFKQGQVIQGSGSATTLPTITIVTVAQLTANDYIELYAFISESARQVAGGASNTYFSGFLISAT